MADNTMMKLEVDVPIDANGLVSLIQYGMMYPDGSIVWGKDVGTHAGVNGFDFSRLKGCLPSPLRDWRWITDRRAKEGKVDPGEYWDGHMLLTRTVIVGTMQPEQFALGKPVATEPVW